MHLLHFNTISIFLFKQVQIPHKIGPTVIGLFVNFEKGVRFINVQYIYLQFFMFDELIISLVFNHK